MADTADRPRAPAPARGRRFARADLLAGFTVALVLIPQSLAYAELAGMPPERGLYAATIALLVAAPLASSRYLQTGPVAVTALLTFGALSTQSAPGSAEYVALGLLLAVIVGLVRIAIGLAGAGVIAYLMSQPMLIGFIPAAAILIMSSQVPNASGSDPPDGAVVERALWALGHPGTFELAAVLMAVGTVVLVFAGRRWHPLFPGVLVAVVVAVVLSELLGYGGVVVGEIPVGAPPISLDLPYGEIGALLIPGTIIAIVGFAEPASIARRFAAEDRDIWDADREFVSQGAANVAAGLSGGFPVGGSFSRSSLNRLAGGQSRWSGAVTGLVVLAVLPVAFLLEPLPKAILGAVVISAVLPLVQFGPFAELWRRSKPAFLVAASTFAATILFEPHVERGVLVGVGLSIAVHLWRELRVDLRCWVEGDTLHVRPSGVLWFGVAQAMQERILAELAARPDVRRLVVHLDAAGRFDITAAMALRSAFDDARAGGVEPALADVQERDRRLTCMIDAEA
ncbi:SulP family inorganic anion transporter [Paraconexibacter sp.]|uniref:SulP family inorganic anion transporter n=1 Tax=Paraconexibacter sp. TaxID=2949640 RepID=UPI003561AC34